MSLTIGFLAFHGQAFSGKDTACRLMTALAGKETHVIVARFAEPIYQMVRALLPFAHSSMSKEEKEKPRPELGGLSVRQLMIATGEGARKYDDRSWCNLWKDQLATAIYEAVMNSMVDKVLVLVPDMRKEAELAIFREVANWQGSIWFPELPAVVQTGYQVVKLTGIGGPENEQVDAATERMMDIPDALEITNDHAQGKFPLLQDLQ